MINVSFRDSSHNYGIRYLKYTSKGYCKVFQVSTLPRRHDDVCGCTGHLYNNLAKTDSLEGQGNHNIVSIATYWG